LFPLFIWYQKNNKLERIQCSDITQISKCAKLVIDLCRHCTVWVFQGEMGAGKTTLIKAIASEMGVVDLVHSPSYGLVNEYEDSQGSIYYHFDFYRINDPLEAVEMGVEEYFDSGNYCWVEWPEKIQGLLPEAFIKISIRVLDGGKRDICVTKLSHGSSDGIH
jgi:tRNA threonylcarbamoyladenosine biosynthesis protein TsaE